MKFRHFSLLLVSITCQQIWLAYGCTTDCTTIMEEGVDGGWSDFGAWSQCSATCGKGVQERSRTCTNPPPAFGGEECTGDDKETRECQADPCGVAGGWSEFGAWGKCKCIQERSRTCTNPPPAFGGEECTGDDKETKECEAGPAVVDGGYSPWGEFTKCSKTCGTGRKHRFRTCTNPPPSGGGKKCKGKNRQNKKCKIQSCKES